MGEANAPFLNSHRLQGGPALPPVSLRRKSVFPPINACFTYTSYYNYSAVINKGNNTSGANCGSKQMYKMQRHSEGPHAVSHLS